MKSPCHIESKFSSHLIATGSAGPKKKLLILAVATVAGAFFSVRAEFVPGAGGSIPVIMPLQSLPNQIGGLKVDQTDRENNTWSGGTRAIVDFSFPAPSVHGADGYDLQVSPDGGSTWALQFSTSSNSQNNFSVNPDGSYSYRLLVKGGPKNGYTSNVVSAPVSNIDTRFAGWGFDESMFISGVMMPWVGRGMTASFVVRKLSDDSDVTGGLSCQWYRVNPLTSEMTLIPGATGLTYITTMDDVGGFHFICKASGDGVSVGGFIQTGSSQPILIPNNSFASHINAGGFRLNLYKSVASLTPADLRLNCWNGTTSVDLTVTGVTPLAGNASFDIAVAIPADARNLYLSNVSNLWALGAEMFPGHFMQALNITIPAAGFDSWAASMGIAEGRRGAMDCNGPLDMQNFAAYAMGLNPLTAAAADLPTVSTIDSAAGTMHLIYRRAKNLPDAKLTPRISGDLVAWSDAVVTSTTVVGSGADWERVDALISFPPGPRRFFKLAAETVP